MTKWIIISEDGNGKIHIFHKQLNDMIADSSAYFVDEIRDRALNVLCVYREKDIIEDKEI